MLNIFKTENTARNYVFMKLKFSRIREEGGAEKSNEAARVMITNVDAGYSWETRQVYAALFILSAFNNIEKNERILEADSEQKLYAAAGQGYFEAYFPVDQMVFQQLRCAPNNLEQLPDYEIHLDQRARIPLAVGNQKLWLAILNEDDLHKVDKHKRRKGDLDVRIDAAS